MSRLAGEVAFVTGAGRGQGRSHAVHLADEGADLIITDIGADIASNAYPLSTAADLEETVQLIEKSGRRVISGLVDVRDRLAMKKFLGDAVAELGGLHVVVANAAICPLGFSALDRRPRRTPRGPTRTPLHPLPSPQGRRPHEPSMQRNERRVAWAEGRAS